MHNITLSLIVLGVVIIVARFVKGFLSNIAVLLGIVVGALIAAGLGMMHYDKIAAANWFEPIPPFALRHADVRPVLIVTMTLVMIVVMIESTGMFLALQRHDRQARSSQADLAAGLRTDGLGTLIGGIFNTFPYTSLLAERRPGRGHRHPLALRLRRGRRHCL